MLANNAAEFLGMLTSKSMIISHNALISFTRVTNCEPL